MKPAWALGLKPGGTDGNAKAQLITQSSIGDMADECRAPAPPVEGGAVRREAGAARREGGAARREGGAVRREGGAATQGD
ncbi:hypothetical protein [Sorangium sp. So ce1151]|uniref:hypothetical protein n=1 Tax=Sorangium sp. So ce1151 TaxID=3133332 RepID=UPI003F62D7B5